MELNENDGIDLSVAETRAALKNPKAILAVRPTMWGGHPQVERALCIVFRGEWFEVCRTDLYDDVCTSKNIGPTASVRGQLEYWRKHVMFGARIKRDANQPLPLLAIIDSLSDG